MKFLNARVGPGHVIIPAVTILTAVVIDVIVANNLSWYAKLNLPAFTPGNLVAGFIWIAVFVLATISAIIVWDHVSHKIDVPIMAMFIISAFFNVLWSYVFFALHDLSSAVWAAGMLAAVIIVLILLVIPHRRKAAWLLVPYLIWFLFLAYLTNSFWLLNH